MFDPDWYDMHQTNRRPLNGPMMVHSADQILIAWLANVDKLHFLVPKMHLVK